MGSLLMENSPQDDRVLDLVMGNYLTLIVRRDTSDSRAVCWKFLCLKRQAQASLDQGSILCAFSILKRLFHIL